MIPINKAVVFFHRQETHAPLRHRIKWRGKLTKGHGPGRGTAPTRSTGSIYGIGRNGASSREICSSSRECHAVCKLTNATERVACLSSFGKGIIEEDGLDLFEWLREGLNIERLKKGLLQIYSSEDASSHVRPMQYVDLGAEATTQKKQSGLRGDATQPPASLLTQFSQAWVSKKLEWIASPQADLHDRLPLLSLETPHLRK